jgi:hypothetical protein
MNVPPEESTAFTVPSEFIAIYNLVAARDCKGWERFLQHHRNSIHLHRAGDVARL